jgi:hypothetical protein
MRFFIYQLNAFLIRTCFIFTSLNFLVNLNLKQGLFLMIPNAIRQMLKFPVLLIFLGLYFSQQILCAGVQFSSSGPGTPPRVLAAGVRKVKSNNATVRMRTSPISPEPPFFVLPRVDAGENLIMEAGSENRILNGIPFGGNWSGPGVSPTGVFSPSSCGTFKLFYSVPDVGIDSVLCMVIGIGQNTNPPPVSISGPDFICASTTTVVYTGSPAGGFWSPASGGGTVNAADVPQGIVVNLEYSTTINSCTYTQSKTIPVYPAGIQLTSSEESSPCEGQSRTIGFELQMLGEYEIKWYKNGAVLTGENENNLLVNQSGSYKSRVFPAGSTCVVPSDSVSISIGTSTPPVPPLLVRNDNIIEMSNYAGTNTNTWYRNGELIPAQTSSSITAVLSGIYHAVHKTGDCTSDYSNGILFQGSIVTGTGLPSMETFRIFPNPVSDFFRVSDAAELKKVSISDLLGRRQILSIDAEKGIDVRTFPPGIYVVEITDQSGKLKKQVLVKQ